jgi:hypothetical protein
MPGGPKRIEGRDYYELPRVLPPLVLSEEELRWDEAMRVLRRARSFQMRAKALTRAHGISFASWEVLEVTERLIREKDDVVCQLEVAARAELAKARVSESMRALMLQGLVNIAPDYWAISDRILMTDDGKALIRLLRGRLVEVARVLVEPVTRAQR